jgi:transposase
VWRPDIVVATADGLGTTAIMRRTGKSKPCVWRWQERYMDDGVSGLLRDKTRPSRIAPLSAEKKLAHREDGDRKARQRYALERSQDGQGRWRQPS